MFFINTLRRRWAWRLHDRKAASKHIRKHLRESFYLDKSLKHVVKDILTKLFGRLEIDNIYSVDFLAHLIRQCFINTLLHELDTSIFCWHLRCTQRCIGTSTTLENVVKDIVAIPNAAPAKCRGALRRLKAHRTCINERILSTNAMVHFTTLTIFCRQTVGKW